MNRSYNDFYHTMQTTRKEEMWDNILAQTKQAARPEGRAKPARWMYLAAGAAAAACLVLVVVALLPKQERPGPLFPFETPAPTHSPDPAEDVFVFPTDIEETDADPTPTPEPREDMALFDAYKLYEKYYGRNGMDKKKLRNLRDEVYAGRTLEELLPNERYNAKLLNFMIDEFKDNQYDCAIGPSWSRVSNHKKYPADKEIEIDLNGDGVPERIQIVSVWDDEEGPISRLLVNDVEYYRFTSWSGEWIPVDEFYIVDIDTTDNYKEIAIWGSNAVSTDFLNFFYYDGEKVVRMGSVQGAYLYNGDGTVTGWEDTWGMLYTPLPVKYKLDKDHMLTLVYEIYKLDYRVFVLRDMPLYTSRDIKSATILMEKGTVVRITGTDIDMVFDDGRYIFDMGWTQITLPDGRIGWIWGEIANSKESLDVTDVFFCIRNEG